MSKTIVVSIEDQLVQVLHATGSAGAPVLTKTLTLRAEELDLYLQQEKSRNFVVVAGVTDFNSGTFTVPIAKEKFTQSIIEAEIRKQFKLQAFEYIHTVLGEKTVARKRVQEVFVFAVDRAHIDAILDRFMAHGKTVTALYPDLFVVARFLKNTTEPVLGVMETGSSKKLFLVKDGTVRFVRLVPSFEQGIREIDLQNIIMTVNYCRQTLKTGIQRSYVLGSLCLDYEASLHVPFPLTSFTHPIFSARIPDKPLGPSFLAPVACLGIKSSSSLNLVPQKTKKIFLFERALRYTTSIFLLLLVYLCMHSIITTRDIRHLRNQISTTRGNLSNVSTLVDRYQEKSTRFALYRPFLDALRTRAAQPDTFRLLQHLGSLSLQQIKVGEISVDAGTDGYTVGLKGTIDADGYARLQALYRAFVESITGNQQFALIDQELDIERKQFHVTFQYR